MSTSRQYETPGDLLARRPADAVVAEVLALLHARALGFEALLQLSSIEWSRRIGSACVECRAMPRLLLNPEFVAEHCATPRALAFLLMHELSHVSFGHTGLFPRVTPAHNVAFDAVINATLLQGLRQRGASVEGWDTLVCRLYAATEAPWFLLRPPPGWPDRPDWEASGGAAPALRDVHRRLYTVGATADGDQVSYAELLQALASPPALEGNQGGTGGDDAAVLARLLGAHGTTAQEREATQGARDHEARQLLAAVLEALPGVGAEPGRGGATTMVRVHADREAWLVHRLRILLRRTLCDTASAHRWTWDTQPVVTVDPSRDRRAATRRHAARRLGAPPPLLHQGAMAKRRLVPAGSAAVYLDVSGSMGKWIGRLHAALRPLHRLLAPELFAFSTEVHALSHAALRRGALPTTGGTDLEPVLRHLAAWPGPPPRRVLVLTDGWVGTPASNLCRQVAARDIALHVGLVDSRPAHAALHWAASVSVLDA
jgi:hypothetical protein